MIEQQTINTLRMLSIDAIEKANSGHPGLPMGAAPMTYTLWANHLRYHPTNPNWFDRDRFVLSAGHGSALLYSSLHLFGYDVSIDDLKQFRQWNSRTPGHPEYGHTPGVEATTGPLGQGIATAVGMAMTERHLAAIYNQPEFPMVDHYTYVLCGDGDLMEGISYEACSLAGHLKLNKLILLYDSNQISLDGDLNHSFSEDIKTRFQSMDWQVITVADGNDISTINQAIDEAKQETDRPTLIEVKTVIGYGSPNRAGTSEAHGKPLGTEEVHGVRKTYDWMYEESFFVPTEVKEHLKQILSERKKQEEEWQQLLQRYEQAYPELAKELKQAISNQLPEKWAEQLPKYQPEDAPMATREASGSAIQSIAEHVPTIMGGSADLASSNNTEMKKLGKFSSDDYAGKNIWFGVREHAMGAILNGMSLHGGVKAYGGTFLVFSDYLRPAIRLAALSNLPVIYVFTHDSIAVGEDGPTHEPVEQIPSLRLIPGLDVIRPADANETIAAWEYAIKQKDRPVALVLSRQKLPHLSGSTQVNVDTIRKGAYIVSEAPQNHIDGILIATGSEVSLAIEAQRKCAEEGISLRVISVPCREQFDHQSSEYKLKILPSEVKRRVAIEAAHPMGWDSYVGDQGIVIGINQFGASAPGNLVMKNYGFHVDHIVVEFKKLMK